MHHYGDVSNLNAPYDAIAVQGYNSLGQVTWDGRTLPSKGFVWREPSSDTLGLQGRTNQKLAQHDKCPLLLDGELGPRTCGALHYLQEVEGATSAMVSVCLSPPESPIAPSDCPAGVAPAPPQPEPLPPVEPKKAGFPMWIWGVGLAAVAIGAAMMLKKKKR